MPALSVPIVPEFLLVPYVNVYLCVSLGLYMCVTVFVEATGGGSGADMQLPKNVTTCQEHSGCVSITPRIAQNISIAIKKKLQMKTPIF